MVIKLKHIILLCFLGSLKIQAQSLISYVSINKESAYIGQPVQLTVSVYTDTWFTSGVDVGNIQVEGALTVYFRSVSNNKTFSSKNYSGVDFIYNLFPTKSGEITIPELSIEVESPKPGGYEGIKHNIKTKPKTLKVNDIPIGYDPNNWLVSSSLNIIQSWNTTLDNVKVGDVLQRTITRSAGGTLSEFIPAQVMDSIPGVSLYPTRPKVETKKTKTYVSATRSETVNYLFEKEGTVIIPKIEFVYWNYNTNKSYKKVIDSVIVQVAPNADLEMLATIKKQLEQEQIQADVDENMPFLIFGMSPKRFLVSVVLGVLILYLVIKLIIWLIKTIRKSYHNYLNSERYLFQKVIMSLKKRNVHDFYVRLNVWVLHLNMKEHNFDYFLKTYGTDDLKVAYDKMNNSLFEKESENSIDYHTILEEMKISRKNYFNKLKENDKMKLDTDWLNPIR